MPEGMMVMILVGMAMLQESATNEKEATIAAVNESTTNKERQADRLMSEISKHCYILEQSQKDILVRTPQEKSKDALKLWTIHKLWVETVNVGTTEDAQPLGA